MTIYNDLFANKDSGVFYVPLLMNCDDYDMFFVELIECIEAYLWPMKYGLFSNDILDFLDSGMENLIDFLRLKRYVADHQELLSIAKKYSKGDTYYKVSFIHCEELSIEALQKRIIDTLNAIINGCYKMESDWTMEIVTLPRIRE